ncbi:MAG TPA: ATP-binding protein [Terracidiphilus sp.]|nr:ATP-binding protein [Terracidiphilus sp.]
MLKRLYIDNFRCFVNFEYKPERKQLLLGANGSGKSSLLDAILFIKWFIKGESNEFTQKTRTRWDPKPLQVLELEAELDGAPILYRLEIHYSEEQLPSVRLERLTASGTPVFEFSKGELHFLTTTGDGVANLKWKTAESSLRLAQQSNPHVGRFIDWLDTVHCFQIDPYPDVVEEKADTEDFLPEYNLSNLAPWYRHLLLVDPEGNGRFLSALREALASFQALRFSTEDDGVRKLRADFLAEGKKKVPPFSLSELSEGQRMLIGLYMVLHFAIAKGHTVILDEPDNFISLREIQPWLISAEEAVDDHNGQLILISHHPEILNQWAKDFGLLFTREENGHVRTKPFSEVNDTGLEPAETIARGWEDE